MLNVLTVQRSMRSTTYKEGLVVELSTVDRLAAGAGAVGEVPPLQHKLWTKCTTIATREQKNVARASDAPPCVKRGRRTIHLYIDTSMHVWFSNELIRRGVPKARILPMQGR